MLLPDNSSEISAAFFKKHIIHSVTSLFGEVAAATSIDLLKYDSVEKRGILRVSKDHYVKLRSSLTLSGTYEDCSCVYNIHKATPLLLALLAESRTYQH